MARYAVKVGKVYQFSYNGKPRLGRLKEIHEGYANRNLLFKTTEGFRQFSEGMIYNLVPATLWTRIKFWLGIY